MPVKVTAYKCQFGCTTRPYMTEKAMARHEKTCFGNPERRACQTCGNLSVESETVYNPNHGGNPGSTDYERKYTYCAFQDEPLEGLKFKCEGWRPMGK